LPGDTPEGLERTLGFVRGMGLAEHTQVFRTQVLPGTELRERAAALGVAYEERPPYFALSTPTWSGDALEAACAHAEETLGVSHAPEDRPVLPSLRRFESGVLRAEFETTGLAYGVGYDLAHDAGRQAAAAEDFARVATTLSAVFRIARASEGCAAVEEWVRRCTVRNPFISLSVVVCMAPGEALEPLGGVRNALLRHRGSRYCERMVAAPWLLHPQRRLLCLLPEEEFAAIGRARRDAIVEAAEIVWRTACDSWEEAAARAADTRINSEDYLFLDLAEGPAREPREVCLQLLAARAKEPAQILLPALTAHWAWLRFLEATPSGDA
jgi:hypothetical protein